MLPPPAPISIMLIVGIPIGRPLPGLNRSVLAVSKSLVISGSPSSTRQILAVVPPMSKETTRERPMRRL